MPSPPPIVQIHWLHQVAIGSSFPCSSSAPCNNYHHSSRFWDQVYGPIRKLWSQFQIYLTGEFQFFFSWLLLYRFPRSFENGCRRSEGSERYEFLQSWVLSNLFASVFCNGSRNRIVLLSAKTNPGSVGIRWNKHIQPKNKPVRAVIHDYQKEKAILSRKYATYEKIPIFDHR